MEYNNDDWKAFKKKHSLTNKDVADIIGTSENNVKNQASPSKKLPAWARGMIWADKQEKITDLVDQANEVVNKMEHES